MGNQHADAYLNRLTSKAQQENSYYIFLCLRGCQAAMVISLWAGGSFYIHHIVESVQQWFPVLKSYIKT